MLYQLVAVVSGVAYAKEGRSRITIVNNSKPKNFENLIVVVCKY